MRIRLRLASAGVLAVLVLLAVAALVNAEDGFEVEEGATPTLTARELTVTDSGSGVRIVCPVTLRGTLDEVIPKSAGEIGGEVTSASAGTCTGGSASFLAGSLPWYAEYESFTGTLPNITSVTMDFREFSALASILGGIVACLYRGSLRGTLDATTVTEVRVDESVRLPLASTLAGICPDEVAVSGTLAVSPTFTLTLFTAGEEGGRFSSTPTEVRFEDTAIGQSRQRTLALDNTTPYTVRIHSVRVSGDARFEISPSRLFALRGGGATANTTVTFRPTAGADYAAELEFVELLSDGTAGGVILRVRVRGRGI